MTQKEFEHTLRQAVEDALDLVVGSAPYRKGDLSRSIKLIATDLGYQISVNIDYMKYTEEAWISPQWKGRANPNEGWFAEVAELVFRLIRARLRASGRMIK